MRSIVAAFALSVAMGPGIVFGQVESGPETGSTPRSFSTYIVVGEGAEKSVDIVAERGNKPTVFLFIPASKWSRPVARFAKALDTALEKGLDEAPEAAIVAVWVTPEPASSKEYLPRAQQSLMFTKTALTVFEGNQFGPEGWSLNDAADVTAVVVNKGKVIRSFGFLSANETVTKDVIAALTSKNGAR